MEIQIKVEIQIEKGLLLQIKIQIGSPLQLHDRDDDDPSLLQPPCLLVGHGGDDVTL